MKSFTYGIIGSSGRMGREIVSLFNEEGHQYVFEFDVEGEKKSAVPRILIDFSLPEALPKTIFYCRQFNSSLIIGTTGLKEDQIEELKNLSKDLPVIQSSNFSIGIQMLLKCTELLNQHLPGWDVEISETHHRFKKDKPSGTALLIKKTLNKNVNISSMRLGDIPGDHTVLFGGLGEVISIKHSATSRKTFAEGVLKSAYFLLDKKNGFYSFHDVLFNKEVK